MKLTVNQQRWVALAALSGGLTVALGAFAAHALKAHFSAYQLSIWQTAVQYQMFHSLALFGVGLVPRLRHRHWIALGFAAGILLFCGSLYLLALTQLKLLGAITPVGGSLWLLSWLALAVQLLRAPRED